MVLKLLAKNTTFLFISDMVERLLSTILVIVIARTLGDELFGAYSFAMAFCGIFIALSNCGINELIARDGAQDKDTLSSYLHAGIILRFFLSVSAYIICLAAISFSPVLPSTKIVVGLFGMALLLDSLSGIFGSIFRAAEKMRYIMISSIVHRVIIVSIGIGVLLAGWGLYALAGAFVVGALAQLILYRSFMARQHIDLTVSFDKHFVFTFFKKAWPFGLVSVFVILLARVDTVMLSFLKGNQAVGWYRAAYVFLQLVLIIPSLFRRVFFPTLSRLGASEKTMFIAVCQKAVKYSFIIALPLTVGISVCAGELIHMCFGPMYDAAHMGLCLLIWAFPLMFVSNILGTALNAAGKERLSPMITGMTLIVNVIGNILFIPLYAHIGAVIGLLLATIVNVLLTAHFFMKHVSPVPWGSFLAKPVISSFGMAVVIFVIPATPVIMKLFILGLGYFLLVYNMGVFLDEEKTAMRTFMRHVFKKISRDTITKHQETITKQ